MDFKYKTPNKYTENTLVFKGRWDISVKDADLVVSKKDESYNIPIGAIMKIEYEVWNMYRFYFIAYTADSGSFIVLKDVDDEVIAVLEIANFRNKSQEIIKALRMIKARNGDLEIAEPVKSAIEREELGPIKQVLYKFYLQALGSVTIQCVIIGALVYLGFTLLLG